MAVIVPGTDKVLTEYLLNYGPVDAANKLLALEKKEYISRYSNARPQILGETEEYCRLSTVDEEFPCGLLE